MEYEHFQQVCCLEVGTWELRFLHDFPLPVGTLLPQLCCQTDIVDIASCSAAVSMACAGEMTTCEAWQHLLKSQSVVSFPSHSVRVQGELRTHKHPYACILCHPIVPGLSQPNAAFMQFPRESILEQSRAATRARRRTNERVGGLGKGRRTENTSLFWMRAVERGDSTPDPDCLLKSSPQISRLPTV